MSNLNAKDFASAFVKQFENDWQTRAEEVSAAYRTSKQWTTYLLGGSKTREASFLYRVAAGLLGFNPDQIRFEIYRTDFMLWSSLSKKPPPHDFIRSGEWCIDLVLEAENDIGELEMTVRGNLDFMATIKACIFYTDDEPACLATISRVIRSQPFRQVPSPEHLFLFGGGADTARAQSPSDFWNCYLIDDHGRWQLL